MRSSFTRFRAACVGLAICLPAGIVGAWALRPTNPAAALGDLLTPAETLAAIPASSSNAAVDRAITHWSAKLRQNARDADTWAELGDALMQKARETADAGYYNHAERAFRQALALSAKHVNATTGVAWVHGSRHEFEESITWAKKALELDPANHAAYGLLGDADIELGDYDAAYEHYQKMLDLRPALSSYSRGANLLFLTGNIRKADWLMAKAIDAGGPYAENTAWCRAQRALMRFHEGNLKAAEQIAEEGLRHTPNNYHLLAAMGRVKTAKKEYPAAIEHYQKAIAVAPQHEALAALGDVYLVSDKTDDAERQYKQVEAIHQLNRANGVRGDGQMARFYADHDRNLAEALRLAEEEHQTRKNVYAADTLAWCLYKNGRFEEAKRLLPKALGRKTPDASILFHAGMIHAKLGDRVTAQKHLYQALSLNPHFDPLQSRVASDVLKQLGSAAAPQPSGDEGAAAP